MRYWPIVLEKAQKLRSAGVRGIRVEVWHDSSELALRVTMPPSTAVRFTPSTGAARSTGCNGITALMEFGTTGSSCEAGGPGATDRTRAISQRG